MPCSSRSEARGAGDGGHSGLARERLTVAGQRRPCTGLPPTRRSVRVRVQYKRRRCLPGFGGLEPHRGTQVGAAAELAAVELPRWHFDAQRVIARQQITRQRHVLIDAVGVV